MTASSQHRLLNLAHTVLLVSGIAAICWLVLSLLLSPGLALAVSAGIAGAMMISPGLSPQSVLRAYGARKLTDREFPQAVTMLHELARRAGLPAVPDLYYLPTSVPNAFATGSVSNSAVCVSDGLLRILNQREFAGVLAHEVSHIAHRDLWIMGFADMMSRAVSLASYVGQFLLIINLPLALMGAKLVPWLVPLLLIIAPTLVSLLQLALSRSREFDADRGGATLSGDPMGLASALAKLERRTGRFWEELVLPGRRIPDPSLLRSHPKTEDRIARLRDLAETRPRAPAHPQTNLPVPVKIVRVERRPRLHWTGLWH
ncbi:MAG: zinc metalloprotease HtpX [Pseudomonadota bacterium]